MKYYVLTEEQRDALLKVLELELSRLQCTEFLTMTTETVNPKSEGRWHLERAQAMLVHHPSASVRAAVSEIEAAIAVVERLERERDAESAIVDRVWKALGITTYEQANGKAIDEIVKELRQKASGITDAPETDGIALIAAERKRQLVVERWSQEHDDGEHADGSLAMAAACYAVMAKGLTGGKLTFEQASEVAYGADDQNWPWGYSWWKPARSAIRNLEKAGALIAAEIDRQLRKGNSVSSGSPALTSASDKPETSLPAASVGLEEIAREQQSLGK